MLLDRSDGYSGGCQLASYKIPFFTFIGLYSPLSTCIGLYMGKSVTLQEMGVGGWANSGWGDAELMDWHGRARTFTDIHGFSLVERGTTGRAGWRREGADDCALRTDGADGSDRTYRMDRTNILWVNAAMLPGAALQAGLNALPQAGLETQCH
jgi:hypothetical protein